jgi:hypothetical protein
MRTYTASDLMAKLLELERWGYELDEIQIVVHDGHDDEYYFAPDVFEEKIEVPGSNGVMEQHLVFDIGPRRKS